MEKKELLGELNNQITQASYLAECAQSAGIRAMNSKKADFLFGLQREIQSLQAELERVKAERDYAVDCIGDIITGADPCDHCNSNKDCHKLASCPSRNYINFQWRGLTTNT